MVSVKGGPASSSASKSAKTAKSGLSSVDSSADGVNNISDIFKAFDPPDTDKPKPAKPNKPKSKPAAKPKSKPKPKPKPKDKNKLQAKSTATGLAKAVKLRRGLQGEGASDPFYPSFQGGFCVRGHTWPDWMGEPMHRETHLFETGEECCATWFPHDSSACRNNIVVMDGTLIVDSDERGTWHPSLNGRFECINGIPPAWMVATEGYSDAYVFDTHAECCKAHWCDS